MTLSLDVTLTRQRLRLGMSGASQGLSSFLQSYFEPYGKFEPVRDECVPVWTIDVHGARAPFAMRDGSHTDVDKSGGFLRCEARYADIPDDIRVLRLLPFDVHVRVARRRRRVELWGESEASLRIPTLRVIEDLVTREVELAAGTYVHASAAVAGGHAILLCGNKRAGKTSGLCRLMNSFDSLKMANDNCVLVLENGGITALGWPGFFKLELGTIAGHPPLGGHFPEASRDLLADSSALWAAREKVPLYPRQGAHEFGTDIVPEAPLGCIVFPRFDAACPPEVGSLALERVRRQFREYVQGSCHPNHPDWMGLGTLGEAERERILAALLDALARVPLYYVRWALSYDDLLATLPVLRPHHRGIRASAQGGSPASAWPVLPNPSAPHELEAPSPSDAATPPLAAKP